MGDSDLEQVWKIVSVLGTPTEAVWPGVTGLPGYMEYKDTPAIPFKSIFAASDADSLDLMAQLLTYNPSKRPSASQALEHSYFTSGDEATPSDQLPRPGRADDDVHQEVPSQNGGADLFADHITPSKRKQGAE